MKKTLICPMVIGFFFVSILGTFAHFFYEWSGYNPVVALFTPVNESIWEHIKLLFFPMLLYSFYLYYRFGRQYPDILCRLFTGLLIGCLFIPVSFYTYTGILGHDVAAIDIAIFYFSVLLSFWIASQLTFHTNNPICCNVITGLLVFLLIILFFIFTWYPPDIFLFESP